MPPADTPVKPDEKPEETTPAEKADEETLPVASREDLQKATPKLEEEVIPIPEVGYAVKVRALTAGKDAMVNQISLRSKHDGTTEVDFAQRDVELFLAAVVEPQLRKKDVQQFHRQWPAGAFTRVTDWVNEKAGKDKEEKRKARDEFRGPEES